MESWTSTISEPIDFGDSVSESITVTDNRTGESVEIPIENGAVDAAAWKNLLPYRISTL